jgi:hypothetical protein
MLGYKLSEIEDMTDSLHFAKIKLIELGHKDLAEQVYRAKDFIDGMLSEGYFN